MHANDQGDVADLFITEELAQRPPKRTNYLLEKQALQELAARMADAPEDVLPSFVDLAMKLTGGVSAGLSLYEPDPAPGVFRWRFLQGRLSTFEGATTPRNFSPCGVTLDRNGPVLSLHPERVYDWISDASIVVPEVLLVPLYLGGAAPLGTLWIVSACEGHFDSGDARAMTELAAFVGIAVRMLQSEERLKRALEEQETLAKEMSHRLKNVFAVIDGMIRASAREPSAADMAKALSGRLHALASAHTLVRRNLADVAAAPEPATDLTELIAAVVRPHQGAGATRFHIEGPTVELGGQAVNGIALVVHEMATNAAKYGALTSDEGTISIAWQIEGDDLVLNWTEAGGPSLSGAPTKAGFGTKLVEMTVARQLEGSVAYDWDEAGLAVAIRIVKARLHA